MATKRAPWKRDNPRKRAGRAAKKLNPKEKSAAKARARRAGRPYPNLVDNMRVASKKKTSSKKSSRKRTGRKLAAHATARKTSSKKTSSKKTSSKKTSAKKKKRTTTKRALENPKGGLTAAGRKAFEQKDGAHLKPGVTKKQSDMTPSEMRRKGSWAVRFYGRKSMPPLVDRNGEPTRHALSAHAWGEPVPKTVAAARRIAAKGKRLLTRYKALKQT